MKSNATVLMLAVVLALSGCLAFNDSTQVSVAPAKQQIVFPPPPDQPRFYYERSIYSSADVRRLTRTEQFKIMMTGEQRSAYGLEKPYAVAAHQGRVFVGDTVRRAVMVFDFVNDRFYTIGEDDGRLAMPLGLDVDRQGNVYVADATAKKILVYDRDGRFLRSIADPATMDGRRMFARPAGLAVNPAGTRIYVVDIGGVESDHHRVRMFDAKNGRHLGDIGTRGKQPGQFNLPRDVAVAPDGSIYVVDGGNFRVQQFTADGQFIRSFGQVGRQSGTFSRPKEIAIDAAGRVYVVDAAFGNFQIFTPEGQVLLAVGSRAPKDGPARFMLPSGIAVDEDGRVFMVDQFYRKIDIFRPAGLAAGEGYLGPL